MEFEEVYYRFYPLLVRQAQHYRNCLESVDCDDIVQEMLVHLWNGWKDGRWEGKTESYILQSLWFHSQNYLRRERKKVHLVSLDEPVGGEGTVLKDNIPETLPPLTEIVENKMLIQQIKSDGLTSREKEVFNLYLEEFNLREIGEKLGISHVRVFKIRENIRRKWAWKIK